ncbi:MAG: pyridoxal-phosphate dependent enzyme, partial [Candidatus Hodarchaeales archaeon]
MSKYILRCPKCGRIYKDTYLQVCSHDQGMIRTEYNNSKLIISPLAGMWKYKEWLPVFQHLTNESRMSVFKSEGLSKELGLKNLFIAFNGYFPEKDAFLKTGTFKELEAPPTIARAIDKKIKTLVIASAGNTARSFAYIAALSGFNTVLVVPPNAVGKIWIPTDIEPYNIQLIALKGDKDYFDAISFANKLCNIAFLETEGGARNVARRDG